MIKNRRKDDLPVIGARHLQCFLCFCCLSLAYAMRVNLSVAIVAMTDKNSDNDDVQVFDWSESTKSYLLSSFFWGYIMTQIPGGHIAQVYGAKTLLLFSITLCSLLTLLFPWIATISSWQFLCVLRVIMGLLQGCVHPALSAMLAKWSPVKERGTLGTLCYSGSQFGTVIMLAVSGYIAQSKFGWPGIFYVSGSAGFIWAIFWYFFAFSTPIDHPRLSADEKFYIEDSIGKIDSVSRVTVATPWKQIFTSPPFISLIIVHCTHMWGFWTLLTQIPSYMKNILDVDIKNSALLSSLPYTVMYLLSFVFIYLSKLLGSKENVSLAFSRKFFNTIGHWIPMVSLIGLGYVSQDHSMLAVVLLTLTVGVNAAAYLGFQVNHIDLSPNFAGTLMGITNGAANVMSALAPLAVGVVVTDVTNVNEWRLVFFIAAGFYFIGNFLFITFGKAEVQIWDKPDELVRRVSLLSIESPNTLLNGGHARKPQISAKSPLNA